MLIYLLLRHTFIHRAITNSTANINHLKNDRYHQLKNGEAIKNQDLMWKAYAAAYSEIKSIIQKQIITDHKVLPLSALREKYINELLEQDQLNNDFQSEKLKKKLENDSDISELIAFSKIEWKGCV